MLLERWRLRYEPLGTTPSAISWPAFYKRFMVLLRSLLAQLRLLPSHRLVSSLAKLRGASGSSPIQYALSLPRSPATQPAPAGLGFAAGAQQFSFPAPDGAHGKLDLGVLYRPSLTGRAPSPPATVCVCGGSASAASAAAAAAASAASAACTRSSEVVSVSDPSPQPPIVASAPPAGLGGALISDYMRSGSPAQLQQERRGSGAVALRPASMGGASQGIAAGGSRGRDYSVQQVAQLTAGLTQLTAEQLPPGGQQPPLPPQASQRAPSPTPSPQQSTPPPSASSVAVPLGSSPPGAAGQSGGTRARSQSHIPDGQAPQPSSSPPVAITPTRPRAMSDAASQPFRPRTLSDAADLAAEVRAAAMGVRDPFASHPASTGALPSVGPGAAAGLGSTAGTAFPAAPAGDAAVGASPFPAVAASPPIPLPVASSGSSPPFAPWPSPPQPMQCSSLSAAIASGQTAILGRSPSDLHGRSPPDGQAAGSLLGGSRGGVRASHSRQDSRAGSRPQSRASGSPLDGGIFPGMRHSPVGSPTDGALFPHASLPFGGPLASAAPIFASVPESSAGTPSRSAAAPAAASASSVVEPQSAPSTPSAANANATATAAGTTPLAPREGGVYSSVGHEPLPFAMDEGEDEGGGVRAPGEAAGDGAPLPGRRPRLNSRADEEASTAEAAIGSLMMEVSAAPSLQLFTNPRDGRASPMARSVEDITSQLDRLTRTFHVAGPGRDLADGSPNPSASMQMHATSPPSAGLLSRQRQLGFNSSSTSPVGSPVLPPSFPGAPLTLPPAHSTAAMAIGVSLQPRTHLAVPRTSNTSSNGSPSDGLLFGALPPASVAARPEPLVPVAPNAQILFPLGGGPPAALPGQQPVPVQPFLPPPQPAPAPVQPVAPLPQPAPAPPPPPPEASVAPPAVVAPPMVATQGSTEALLAAGGPIGSGDAALFPFAPTTQREDFE